MDFIVAGHAFFLPTQGGPGETDRRIAGGIRHLAEQMTSTEFIDLFQAGDHLEEKCQVIGSAGHSVKQIGLRGHPVDAAFFKKTVEQFGHVAEEVKGFIAEARFQSHPGNGKGIQPAGKVTNRSRLRDIAEDLPVKLIQNPGPFPGRGMGVHDLLTDRLQFFIGHLRRYIGQLFFQAAIIQVVVAVGAGNLIEFGLYVLDDLFAVFGIAQFAAQHLLDQARVHVFGLFRLRDLFG